MYGHMNVKLYMAATTHFKISRFFVSPYIPYLMRELPFRFSSQIPAILTAFMLKSNQLTHFQVVRKYLLLYDP